MKLLNSIKDFFLGPKICNNFRSHNFLTKYEKTEHQDGNILYISLRNDTCLDCGYKQFYPFKGNVLPYGTSRWSKTILEVSPKEIIKYEKS